MAELWRILEAVIDDIDDLSPVTELCKLCLSFGATKSSTVRKYDKKKLD
jgi:hypothetical protein